MTQAAGAVALAVIPGDGVGPEVVAVTVPVLEAALRATGTSLSVTELDWGGERFLREGAAMPADAADLVRRHDGVLFGAVGRPDVPDHELVWGLIIGLRQQLDLAVNVRPVRAFPGVPTKVRDTDGVDLVIVRENTEGEYVGAGGVAHAGTGHDLGLEIAVHSRRFITRAARHAFDLAARRRGRLSLVTKSNAMRHGYPLWDRVVREVGEEYPHVELEVVLVDAMAARMIQDPRSLDVL
ncbi:MAG: isocitrate/isopropylmalate family dehydrogenase, partial [Nocardioidaceae bacterium]